MMQLFNLLPARGALGGVRLDAPWAARVRAGPWQRAAGAPVIVFGGHGVACPPCPPA